MKNNRIFPKKVSISCLAILALFCSCTTTVVDVENKISFLDTLRSSIYLPDTNQFINYSQVDLPEFYYDQFVQLEINTPDSNPVTNWGALLGKVLFYDKQLSKNNTIACASCHIQKFAFSDSAQFSKGFSGGTTRRHSMSLTNAVFYRNGRFFWNERAASLEKQVLMPIFDEVEMGLSPQELTERLESSEYYRILFRKAFGSTQITNEKAAKALAQFVRSMVSYQSKYDEGRAQVESRLIDFPNFTAAENRGKTIFMLGNKGNCIACHITDVFVGDEARNIGLDFKDIDLGLAEVTGNSSDNGKFKAPSLRNIELTAPYMHDGRFKTLLDVINHYDNEMKANPNLDEHLKNPATGAPQTLNLTEQEKQDLITFMKTLTDNVILEDVRFGNPFLVQ